MSARQADACKRIKQRAQHVDEFDGRLHDYIKTWVKASVNDRSLAAHCLKRTSLGAGLVASKPASHARGTATSQ